MQRNVFAVVIGAAWIAGMGAGFAQSAAPAQTAKPVETARPAQPAKPTETAKPAQAAKPAAHSMVQGADVKWGPAPPSLPPGAQAAVLDGDPAKSGIFVIRLKFPDGYQVPPHSHPTDEHVTVISGTVAAGFGDKADAAATHTLTAGGYAKMPAGTNHYVRAKGESVVQVIGTGPFVVKYANPGDDPRTKTAKP
jgi:quercetin dioxygenase-like cupin family protein